MHGQFRGDQGPDHRIDCLPYPPAANDNTDSDNDGFTDQQEFEYLSLYEIDEATLEQQYFEAVFDPPLHPPPDFSCIPKVHVTVEIVGHQNGQVVPGVGGTLYPGAGTHEFAKFAVGCPDPCSVTAPSSECPINVIIFVPTPAEGWFFKSWSGDCYDRSGATLPVKMVKDKRIVAEFIYAPTLAHLDLVNDLDAFLTALGMQADAYLTFDKNNIAFVEDEQQFIGNGIPDAAEFRLLEKSLQSPRLDLAVTPGVNYTTLAAAWAQNLNQAGQDLQNLDVAVQRAVAAYMTLGDFKTVEMVKDLIETEKQAHPSGPFAGVTIDADAYDRSSQSFLYSDADADSDGFSNLREWQEAVQAAPDATPTLRTFADFAALSLDANRNGQPITAIVSSAKSASSTCSACQTGSILFGGGLGYEGGLWIPRGIVRAWSGGTELTPEAFQDLPAGQEVVLTAQSLPGAEFTRWSVEPALPFDRDLEPKKTVTIEQDTLLHISANFTCESFSIQKDTGFARMDWDMDSRIVQVDPGYNDPYWRHFKGPIGARFTVCAYGAQLASLFDDYEFGTSSIGGVICGNYEDSSYWFALTDYSNPARPSAPSRTCSSTWTPTNP